MSATIEMTRDELFGTTTTTEVPGSPVPQVRSLFSRPPVSVGRPDGPRPSALRRQLGSARRPGTTR